MKKRTAMLIGFMLSVSAMIVIITFLMATDKAAMRPMLFVGIGLALTSLIIRNLIRFKPEWFGDQSTEKDANAKEFDEQKKKKY